MRRITLPSRVALIGLVCAAVAPLPAVSEAVAGAWTPAIPLSGPILMPDLQLEMAVAAHARDGSLAVWNASGAIMAASGGTGTWSAAVDVSRSADYEDVYEPAVAAGAGPHDAVVIWTSSTAVPDQVRVNAIKVAFLRGRGGWTRPRTIVRSSAAGLGSPRVLVARGLALAVWQRCEAGSCVIESSFGPRIGHWTPPVRLSPAGVPASMPELAGDPRRRAVAVWVAGAGGSTQIQAAVHAGAAWAAAEDVSAAEPGTFAPQVAVNAAGEAVAVWNQNTVIVAATRAGTGTWSAPVPLSTDPSFRPPDVAVDREGDAVAAWSDGAAQVATRPRGGTWSAPLVLSAPDEDVGDPRVGTSAAGSLTAVSWIDNAQNTARAVTRTGAAAWSEPVSLGGGTWEDQVELAVGRGACALWGVPSATVQAWTPTVSEFTR